MSRDLSAPNSDGSPEPEPRTARWAAYGRVTWTVVSYIVVQSLIFGVATLPIALLVGWVAPVASFESGRGLVLVAVGMLPTYVVGAVSLMVCTAAATRLLGWRTISDTAMRIRDLGWPLMNWARYLMLTHAVRILVGVPLRGTPLWGFFIRLNGARVGRRVWVNSTGIMDHSLLEFGDDTVIGSDVHLSGHMVEGGVVKTGRVRLGRQVTIGVGSVVGVGTEIGDRCQVGALSFVPKMSRLDADAVYAGAPVHRITGAHHLPREGAESGM